jgi:hypothetical protein
MANCPIALIHSIACNPLSVRLFVDAGFELPATTSGSGAWALSYAAERRTGAEIMAANHADGASSHDRRYRSRLKIRHVLRLARKPSIPQDRME